MVLFGPNRVTHEAELWPSQLIDPFNRTHSLLGTRHQHAIVYPSNFHPLPDLTCNES